MNLLNNAKWNLFSQIIKITVQVINIVYLAKIIDPSEYGLMAMAIVVLNLGILLRDLGTAAAIIQRKELTHELINTIFWLNLFMGVGIAVLIFSLSPIIAEIYKQDKLTHVLMLLSLTFPLSSCAAAHLALLEKKSRFKIISMIEVSSSLLSAIVAIIMANLGYGVYSLVGQAIVLNAVSALQFWNASSWRPTIKNIISLNELKSIFGFSANLSLFNCINYFSRNADSFIIGRYMSAAILGSYNLAYRIMLFPLQSLTFVATRSLYPILSEHQDDVTKIRNIYLNCIFVITLITAPLMTGLALYSKPFVQLVFGEQWHITADVLQWLAPTAIIQAILSTAGSVFMAKGRTDILMKLGILGAILQVTAFFIGVRYNITIFALCYLIANILNFFPVMFFLMKIIGGDIFLLIKKIFPILISTIIMLVFVRIMFSSYPQESIDSIYKLIYHSLIAGIIYFFSLIVLSLTIRKLFLSLLSRLFNKLVRVK